MIRATLAASVFGLLLSLAPAALADVAPKCKCTLEGQADRGAAAGAGLSAVAAGLLVLRIGRRRAPRG